MEDFAWCPKCPIGGVVGCTETICTGCGFTWCGFCRGPAHAEGEACPIEQNIITVLLYKKTNTRPCPGCRVATEHNGGCSHMVCVSHAKRESDGSNSQTDEIGLGLGLGLGPNTAMLRLQSGMSHSLARNQWDTNESNLLTRGLIDWLVDWWLVDEWMKEWYDWKLGLRGELIVDDEKGTDLVMWEQVLGVRSQVHWSVLIRLDPWSLCLAAVDVVSQGNLVVCVIHTVNSTRSTRVRVTESLTKTVIIDANTSHGCTTLVSQ